MGGMAWRQRRDRRPQGDAERKAIIHAGKGYTVGEEYERACGQEGGGRVVEWPAYMYVGDV